MRPLWAPWRMDYILDENRRCTTKTDCVFCLDSSTDCDAERLILYRGEYAFVIMNRFPYNNGHLLIAPFRHLSDLTDLKPEETREMSDLICLSREVLQECISPQGLNVGLNLGEAAGAGIADHLHWHIVPRWQGDTNFMPVLAETRVIPQHLAETYELLTCCFARRTE